MDPTLLQQLLQTFLAQEPTAAFYNAFSPLLGSRNQNLSDFTRSLQPSYYGQFLGQLPTNPTQTFPQFLQGQDPYAAFQNQAPRQRGERPNQFAPPIRFVNPFRF